MGGPSNPACFPDWGAFPPLEPFPNTFGIDEVLHSSQLRRTRGKDLIPVVKLEILVHRCVQLPCVSRSSGLPAPLSRPRACHHSLTKRSSFCS
jgi:hypothetical protein